MLDEDAVRATQRLIKSGFEAYLVGGCVRDLLLGRSPKDYDIATEARPQQVKRVFPRNCRIIGRRFKLAHLHFHGNTKILECSTFRRPPEPSDEGEDVLITRDNEFGTAEEDALRRDFTVNALFLDPTRDTILDYCDGLRDLQARLIRTIGDPRVRFREDPVRILRAAKFAARLGFAIATETFAAMCETSDDLVRSAPPRVLEEILRLLRSGHAFDSFKILREVGALRSLLPIVSDFLDRADADERTDFWRTLDALDRSIQDGNKPQNGVLLGALLVGAVEKRAARQPDRSPSLVAEDLLGPMCATLRLPRKDAGCVKRICGVQRRFAQTDDEKRFRVEGFLHGPYFLEALDLFALRADALGLEPALVEHWQQLANEAHGGFERHDDRFERAAPMDDGADEDGGEPPAEPVGDDASPYDEDRANTEAALAAAEPAEADAAPGNPWEQPGEGESGEPGRRRRRRRRRRGGRRDEAPADAAVGGSADDDAPPAPADALAAPDDDVADGAAPQEVDVYVPEGVEDETDVDVEGGLPLADAPATAPAATDAASGPDDDAAFGPGDGGGRRRRRRRRRRGRSGPNDSVHGSPDAPTDGDVAGAPDAAGEEPMDAEADRGRGGPLAADGAGHDRDDEAEAFAPTADAHARGEGESGDDEAQPHGGPRAQGDGGRRRRRRRRGRGRGRDDGDQPGHGGEHPGGATADAGGQPPRPQPAPQRHQQPQRQGQSGPQGLQQQGHQQPGHQQQGHQHRRGQQQRGQQHGQGGQHGGDRGSRRERGGRRGRDRDRGQGHGRPRDVDVVPRYRDRRGEVDVIEPTALDLSAFDVELDPKRVPTFGSIVEGKGRQKKRAPRVPEDGVDDYRPPPPPADVGGGPAAPPPPPPVDTPDTFGDW
ncbi:MAG: polynucleotide adenylyltransferase PcnB [Planctomycetota bacterium]